MNENENTIQMNYFISQTPGHIVSDMDGEKVMLSIDKGKYFNLGVTGGAIWELMATPVTVEAIVSGLIEQFEVEEKVCREQVVVFLESLLNEGLIQLEQK